MTSIADSATPPSLQVPVRPAAILPAPLVVLAVVLVTSPLWLERIGLYQYLALEIAIFMMYAMGYNLLLGNSGLPSFGHGAFFGVGAYGFGLLQLNVWADLWFDLAGAAVLAALLGGVVGAFISHRRGIYYALLTIAFGQVFWFIAIKWHSVTGGEDGLLNLKRLPAQFGLASVDMRSNEAVFYLTLILLLAVVYFCWRFVHSPLGRLLQCIKQNEMRAGFLGYRVWYYKWLVFALSAGIAGLAGALFAMAQNSAYPNVMSLHQSGFVVMMVLIGGGLTSFWGPLVGAAFFILARDLLGAYTETWLFWYGLLFMAIVMFKPEGLTGIGRDLAARWSRRQHAHETGRR
jgi:branched-chain amino acid transport system permease protein